MQELHSTSNGTNGRWTRQEHLKFLEGLRVYGKNWKKIEQLVATRTGSQIRSHAQKFFLKSLQSSKKEQNQLEVASDEMVEQLQEMTLNTKTISESGLRDNQFSFYLDKILRHCSDKQNLDFWSSLVDSKGKVSTANHNTNNNSFTNFKQATRESELSKSECSKTPL